MGYIYGLIVVGLLFTILHYFTELSSKQKLGVSVLFGVFVLLAYLYNTTSANEQEKILKTVRDFENGKTLTCNNKEINSTFYTLSVGTYTFIGKENTPYYSDMVSASSCR
ncbi:hypothetical protein KKA17_02265 [bacterium]|nr:hypothetical protein [bacterium]MBU1884821.1 hypothetical protein [bacterium]